MRPLRYADRPTEERIHRLTGQLQRFRLQARVLNGGARSVALHFEARPRFSHLALLRQGALEVPELDGDARQRAGFTPGTGES